MQGIQQIKEWFDVKYWYICYLRNPYRTVRCWLRHCFNKTHWKLIKCAFTGYPFDHGYLDDLEELKLKEMLEYHLKSHIVAEPSRTHDIIRTLTWAYNLRHILNNDTDLFHFDGSIYSVPVSGTTLKEIKTDKLVYHYDGPRLNWRNAGRFLTEEQLKCDFWRKHQEEYYHLKAKHLYYLIRERYTEFWWD